MLALTAACLWTTAGKAFRSASEIAGCLDDRTVLDLTMATMAALDVCSPSYTRSDWKAWELALVNGASDRSNITHAMHMTMCADVTIGFGGSCTIGRPDRYFGLPVAELTDGHLMAFEAARTAAEKLRSK
jgi:hypothetical protein